MPLFKYCFFLHVFYQEALVHNHFSSQKVLDGVSPLSSLLLIPVCLVDKKGHCLPSGLINPKFLCNIYCLKQLWLPVAVLAYALFYVNQLQAESSTVNEIFLNSSWLQPGSSCFLGPLASFLLGSRLAAVTPGAYSFTLNSRFLWGHRLYFSRYQDCKCCFLSPGFHLSSPWTGISWCCWISVCHHDLDLWLGPLMSPCAAARLHLCSPLFCTKVQNVGFIWKKLFFF